MKNIYKKFKIGDMEAAAILDSKMDFTPDIFSGVAPELMQALQVPGWEEGWTNSYVIKTNGKTILIDTGWGGFYDSECYFNQALKELNIAPENVDIILISHFQIDHIGGLVKDFKPVFPNAILYYSQREKDYWLAPERQNEEEFQITTKIINAYSNRTKIFDSAPHGKKGDAYAIGDEILPGIKTWALYGHTPGQTAFLLESKGDKLLISADLIHCAAMQFNEPEIYPVPWDVDHKEGIKVRLAMLKLIAEENLPIAGQHLPFPGIGQVRAKGKAYEYLPAK